MRGLTTWRLTNWSETITDTDMNVWTPDNITHGEISGGIEFLAESVTLSGATNDATHPIRYFVDRNGLEETTLTIYKTDASTLIIDTANPLYQGRLQDCKFGERGTYSVECSSVLRVSERKFPTKQVQRFCNHRLGDDFCGIDLTDPQFKTTGTLTDVQPTYVQATAFATKATAESDANWFALGKVTVGQETRMVVGQSTSKLYINAPFVSAAIGQSVSATAGCDKRANTCVDKFDNIANAIEMNLTPTIL